MNQKKLVTGVIFDNPDLNKILESISENLDKIQKSLSDYLETQRQGFSRFYFVGDEDLLEIIGNSKELEKIQKYFSKLFAGINSVKQEDNVIQGLVSKENEQIPLNRPINIL